MTGAITADISGRDLLKIAIGGLVSGLLTPLAPRLIERLFGPPGLWHLALLALPFAVVMCFVVHRYSANPPWAALVAAIATMIAFVAAVNVAAIVHGQTRDASELMRDILAGLSGGLVGTAVMALGMAFLPAGPRKAAAWWPLLITGAVFGPLAALDTVLGLDRTSVLYPVWQAAVAVRLSLILRPV